jgi:hypothetical protein
MKFSGLTLEEMARKFQKMCRKGLAPNELLSFRKALRELARKMHKESAIFRKPVAKNLTISIKAKPEKPAEEKSSKLRKKKKKKEEDIEKAEEIILGTDISAVKHILNG